jgi:glycine/D-amino acid oxidase-like deaminating enzyme
MNLTSELPFWTVKNGLLGVYPSLDHDHRCEALIVGGGITGALLAHELVKKGVKCALIDQRDIGHGSTSASTALLQYEIDTPLYTLRKLVAPAAADRAYLLGVEAIDQLQKLAGTDCGFALRPSLQIARTKSDLAGLRKELAARRELKLPVAMLERGDLRQLGMQGPGALRSGVAAEVDPYRLTHRLLKRGSKQGLEVFDRTAARRYVHTRGDVTVHTDRGWKIRCRTIFFATGYETKDILPGKIVTIKSTYALISEPLQSLDWWTDRSLIWGTGDAYSYMRTTSDKRVLVGGADDAVLNCAKRDRQIGAKTTQLLRRFHDIFPKIPIEPAFGWAGGFGSTKDGLAYIGPHPAFPNAYFALGFGGNGITFSQIAARLLTDLFLGKKNPDEAVFRFQR